MFVVHFIGQQFKSNGSEEQLVDFLSHSIYSYFDFLNASINDPVVLLQNSLTCSNEKIVCF
jgi:hypothetical protein